MIKERARQEKHRLCERHSDTLEVSKPMQWLTAKGHKETLQANGNTVTEYIGQHSKNMYLKLYINSKSLQKLKESGNIKETWAHTKVTLEWKAAPAIFQGVPKEHDRLPTCQLSMHKDTHTNLPEPAWFSGESTTGGVGLGAVEDVCPGLGWVWMLAGSDWFPSADCCDLIREM